MILRFFCPSRFLRRSGHIALPGLSYRFIRLSCAPSSWANPATARGATPSRPQFQDGVWCRNRPRADRKGRYTHPHGYPLDHGYLVGHCLRIVERRVGFYLVSPKVLPGLVSWTGFAMGLFRAASRLMQRGAAYLPVISATEPGG